MKPTKDQEQDVWRNDGTVESIESLKKCDIHVVAIDHILVKFEYDPNYSTSFQMRHVKHQGKKGFAYYVDSQQVPAYYDTFREGTSQDVYDEVLQDGTIVQQEFLRRSWNKLNHR